MREIEYNKAMCSVKIIECAINFRVGTIISQKFQSNFSAIISVFLIVSKIDLFRVLQNKAKQITNHLKLKIAKNLHLKAKTDLFKLKTKV